MIVQTEKSGGGDWVIGTVPIMRVSDQCHPERTQHQIVGRLLVLADQRLPERYGVLLRDWLAGRPLCLCPHGARAGAAMLRHIYDRLRGLVADDSEIQRLLSSIGR